MKFFFLLSCFFSKKKKKKKKIENYIQKSIIGAEVKKLNTQDKFSKCSDLVIFHHQKNVPAEKIAPIVNLLTEYVNFIFVYMKKNMP